MTENPKVFISYSHDSPEHKQWVSELAARLRRDGIDAILDQWDLGLGDDVTRFMERGIVEADRVLVICTDKYVSKANTAEGGVGYERMIVNAELVQNLGTDKFIPIIRQASGKAKTPIFLGTRVYADFTNDSQFDVECEKLIRKLHKIPVVEKPPLGKNPFPTVEIDTQLTEIPDEVLSVKEAYSTVTKLIRAGDTFGWRELIKKIRPKVFKDLVQWRQDELDGKKPDSKEHLIQIVDKAVEIISPLMVVALAGVESGREEFRDQKAFLDDLLNITGWNTDENREWIRLPYALGYVYHSLHGCVGLGTSQIDLALDLAQVNIPDLYNRTQFTHVWKIHELIGWPKIFGPDCTLSWDYVVNVYERYKWLSLIFENDLEYRASLVAYYIALNIHEFSEQIPLYQQENLTGTYNSTSLFDFGVPLTFMTENYEIYDRARLLLLRNPDSVSDLWARLDVTQEQLNDYWNNWVGQFNRWLRNVYRNSPLNDNRHIYSINVMGHRDFLEMLQQ